MNKDLLLELVKREIKARYKQSILGYAWVILVPLLNLGVLSVVFSYFVRVDTGETPYFVYLFAALVPWNFTATSIIAASGSLVNNVTLITKVSLPRAVFPLASILTKSIDFAVMFIIMFIFVIVFGDGIKPTIVFQPISFAYPMNNV